MHPRQRSKLGRKRSDAAFPDTRYPVNADDRAQVVDTVNRLNPAFDIWDIETMVAAFMEDGVVHHARGEVNGHEALRRFYENYRPRRWGYGVTRSITASPGKPIAIRSTAARATVATRHWLSVDGNTLAGWSWGVDGPGFCWCMARKAGPPNLASSPRPLSLQDFRSGFPTFAARPMSEPGSTLERLFVRCHFVLD
jgi:hypothetical protein